MSFILLLMFISMLLIHCAGFVKFVVEIDDNVVFFEYPEKRFWYYLLLVVAVVLYVIWWIIGTWGIVAVFF